MDAIRTANGRLLEYHQVGDPAGLPVICLPGTPATAGSVALLDAAALRQEVRLVGVSRPGYGESTTTAPGLLAVARDVGELASGLGIEEFAVLGISGGGPYALAAGAALGSRVRHVLVAAGPGPYQQVEPELLETEDLQALELLAAGDSEGAASILMKAVRQRFDPLLGLSAEAFREAFARMAPPGEHYFDSRPDDRATFVADFRRGIDRYDGYVRDNLSWLGSWDFDLREVTVPVDLSYGGSDAMVPAVHGEWLAARLPRATLVVHPDAGHGEVSFGRVESQFATAVAQW